MYLNKIKDTALKETKGNITDICLSVPGWYTEKQRRAAADACRIAGLNPVRIVNEVTAAAVGYGVFKAADLPEDEYKKVAFVDVGHSSYQVAIAAVKRGELKFWVPLTTNTLVVETLILPLLNILLLNSNLNTRLTFTKIQRLSTEF